MIIASFWLYAMKGSVPEHVETMDISNKQFWFIMTPPTVVIFAANISLGIQNFLLPYCYGGEEQGVALTFSFFALLVIFLHRIAGPLNSLVALMHGGSSPHGHSHNSRPASVEEKEISVNMGAPNPVVMTQ